MRQKNSKIFTYQTRLRLDPLSSATLQACATHLSRVEYKLFADICSGKESSSLKKFYLKFFGITARQFNACRVSVEGKIASIKERRSGLIAESKERIESLERKIKRLESSRANPYTIHQKKRRLAGLKLRYQRLLNDHKTGKIRLCFGSKKLFRAQFDLKANGFHSHEEWKDSWQRARNDAFFVMGSKDETCGNQSCAAVIQEDNRLTLRLRLPDALIETHAKYLVIRDVHFKYGHDRVLTSLRSCLERNRLSKNKNESYVEFGEAISYRFKRDEKGWIVFVSTSLSEPNWISNVELGTIGVDINADHLAVAEVDRYGNLIKYKNISLCTYGKTGHQSRAMIGDASAEIIEWAIQSKKPIVLEKLEFQKKKTELKETGSSKHARMLSSFSYQMIINCLKSRAWRFAIKVEEVNPVFTSIIGRVKFADRYGITVHESAALCIARRLLKVSERLPRSLDKIPDGKGAHVACPLPVRNRRQHVWYHWRQINKNLSVVLVAHFRTKKDPPSQPQPACCDESVSSDFIGGIPIHESSAALFG